MDFALLGWQRASVGKSRWDNLESKHWDSRLFAKVGHNKLLISLARVAPSTGTIDGTGAPVG
jgi:hypothetical protein